MIEIKEKKNCCGCSACYNVCPKSAIIMEYDDYGFEYPHVDKSRCINCKLCEKVCPIINFRSEKNNPMAYACKNKDEEIRKESSSGGIFTLLGEEIIKNGGVVIGASLDENLNLKHTVASKVSELDEIRKSKYLQSKINNTYKIAKEYLENDDYVLFTGTPCQIAGLKSYLKKDYKRLYTQDIICHGVPSKKLFSEYIKENEKSLNEKIKKINFRNKDSGWKNYSVDLKSNNHEIKQKSNKNDYIKLFLMNIALRDSCYDCKFKNYNNLSDITLGDLWGIENLCPELDDNKGTSLVMLNTNKGKELFERIKDMMICKKIDIEDAVKYNHSMKESSMLNPKRDEFFNDLGILKYKKLIKKYIKDESIFKKILHKIKSVIKIMIH